MRLGAVAALLMLVGSSVEQSGDSADPSDDEDHKPEAKMNFTCYTKLRIENSELFCNITEWPSEDSNEIYFRVCTIINKCDLKIKSSRPLKITEMITDRNICMIWGDNKKCRIYDLKKIAIPDRPTNLSIKYNNESEEYEFDIKVPYEKYDTYNDLLYDKLIHEIVLRKKGEEWPDCEKEEHLHMCYKKFDIRIPKRKLESATEYEARVRSKPNGVYFDGFWSSWTEAVSFLTEKHGTAEKHISSQDSSLFLVIVISMVVLSMLLVTTILIKYFWKSRIKPVIWPEIPDHKNALDKLCKKPKQFIQLSFNPDYFDNMAINKVDHIRALVRVEDGFQISSLETPMEKWLEKNTTRNDIISPAVGSKVRSINGSDTGKWNNPSDHTAADETNNSADNAKIPENVISLLDPCNQKCNISHEGHVTPEVGILGNFPIYSNALKQPNDEFNTYITMSAFKTPPSAITQTCNK